MQVVQGLAALERAGLIRRTDAADLTFIFKHVLTQDSAYASLLRHERRKLHRQVAVGLEDLYGDALEDQLAVLSYHYTRAGDNDKAVQYLTRYGDHATQISAFPEAIQAYENARALAAAPALQAQLLTRLGDVYCRHTDFDAANEYYQSAFELSAQLGDDAAGATALNGLARIANQQGNHARARELGEVALVSARAANDLRATARVLRQLGVATNNTGNNELAEKYLNESLTLAREVQDAETISSCLNSLGILALECGELEHATDLVQQALALSEQQRDRYSVGVRLVNLGAIAEKRGDLDAAMQYQAQALAISQEIGDREGVALIRLNMGSLALTRGDYADAREYLQFALSDATALGAQGLVLYAIAILAKREFLTGNLFTAVELLALSIEHPASTADIQRDLDDVRAGLTGALGAENFQAAWESGRALDLKATTDRLLSQNMLMAGARPFVG